MVIPRVSTIRPSSQYGIDAHSARHFVCFVSVLCSIILLTGSLDAQTTSEVSQAKGITKLGVWGNYGYQQHSVDFSEFRTAPLFSPRTSQFIGPANLRFQNGSGISLGALYEQPLTELLALSLRLGYAQHNALLTTQESVLLGDANGAVTENIVEYRIQSALSTLGLELLAKANLFQGFNLLLGVRGGVLFQKSYTQDERLLLPARGGFSPTGSDGSFNVRIGDIPDAQPLQMWGVGGISYDIPFQSSFGRIDVSPEIFYTYALSSVLSRESIGQGNTAQTPYQWNLHALRGGVSITLSLGGSKNQAIDSTPLIRRRQDSLAKVAILKDSIERELSAFRSKDSIRKVSPVLTVAKSNEKKISVYAEQALLKAQTLINTRQIDIKPVSIVRSVRRTNGRDISDEQEYEKLVLPVQDLLVRDEMPLLPYIFFDGESSTKLPERYARLESHETSLFSPDNLKASSNLIPQHHSYYQILNIVGYRMKKYPHAKLNLLGCTDGFTSEKNRPKLSEVRTSTVAEYLRSVWSIDSTRIQTTELRGTSLPAKASRPLHEADKQAENRRVEIFADTSAILAPILLTDTISHTLSPNMRFYLVFPSTLSVKTWKIRIRLGRVVLKEFRGNGKPPLAIDWRIDAKEMEKLQERMNGKNNDETKLECAFDILETDGAGIAAPIQNIEITEQRFRVNAEERAENVLVERQTLILFDGGKSTLTQEHIETLKGVNARMTASSKISFEGYMDKSGDDEFNERLSLARAQAAAQALRFNMRGAQVDIKGYGSSVLLYDNRFPEGRIYSRAVRITQETPIIE